MSAASPRPSLPAGIRGVLFDAGNTLLWLDHARMAELVVAAGLVTDTARVRDAEMRARPRLDPYLGRAPKRESPHVRATFVDLILDGLAAAGDVRARAADALLAAWGTLWVRPPDDAHATLRELHARGYVLGCVSNSDGSAARLLADAGLAAHLDVVVDSGVVGVEKPDPRIFALASEALRLPPAALCYVGDLHAVDVVGARAAGLHPVLLDPLGVWDAPDVVRVAALGELLRLLPPRVSASG